MPNSDKKQILADLSHISFSYDTKPILQDISLTIQSGERIGIVGESGCGKSTFLKILAGLLPPSSGSVNILGISGNPFLQTSERTSRSSCNRRCFCP